MLVTFRVKTVNYCPFILLDEKKHVVPNDTSHEVRLSTLNERAIVQVKYFWVMDLLSRSLYTPGSITGYEQIHSET